MGWSTADVPQAIAVLKGDSKVTGVITFEQADASAPVTVSGDVSTIPLTVVVSAREFVCHAEGTTKLEGWCLLRVQPRRRLTNRSSNARALGACLPVGREV